MLSFIDGNNLLNKFQSGFRKKHSTCTMLLEVSDNLYIEMDKRHATVMLFIDFTKAFDCVNHTLLCNKLAENFYFHHTAVSLIYNYLTGRTQFVSNNGMKSKLFPVLCGVPQGSLLGPLLFSLYINDLPLSLSYSNCRLYADDAQLYISGPKSKINILIAKLNDDLDGILYWSKRNCLKLNASKTKAMIVHSKHLSTETLPKIRMNGVTIPFVDKIKNLGIFFNKFHTWHDHIQYISKKCYLILRKLWKFSPFLNEWIKVRLVKSLILPHFLYCAVVFSGMNVAAMNYLSSIFNACTRFVTNRRKFDHIGDVSKIILDSTFEKFLQYRYVLFLKKILLNLVPSYLTSKISLGRSSRNINIHIPRHSTRLRHLSFFVKIPTLWNSMPITIRRENNIFKYSELCKNYFVNSD